MGASANLSPEAMGIALAQQDRGRRVAIGDAFNVHGQLESLRFKQVKRKTTALHGKQIRWQKAFTIPHQWLTPKTQGNFRLAGCGLSESRIATTALLSSAYDVS